jgi:hypothetical protein
MYDPVAIGAMIHRNPAGIAEAGAQLAVIADLIEHADPGRRRALRSIERVTRRIRRRLLVIGWVLRILDRR